MLIIFIIVGYSYLTKTTLIAKKMSSFEPNLKKLLKAITNTYKFYLNAPFIYDLLVKSQTQQMDRQKQLQKLLQQEQTQGVQFLKKWLLESEQHIEKMQELRKKVDEPGNFNLMFSRLEKLVNIFLSQHHDLEQKWLVLEDYNLKQMQLYKNLEKQLQL